MGDVCFTFLVRNVETEEGVHHRLWLSLSLSLSYYYYTLPYLSFTQLTHPRTFVVLACLAVSERSFEQRRNKSGGVSADDDDDDVDDGFLKFSSALTVNTFCCGVMWINIDEKPIEEFWKEFSLLRERKTIVQILAKILQLLFVTKTKKTILNCAQTDHCS